MESPEIPPLKFSYQPRHRERSPITLALFPRKGPRFLSGACKRCKNNIIKSKFIARGKGMRGYLEEGRNPSLVGGEIGKWKGYEREIKGRREGWGWGRGAEKVEGSGVGGRRRRGGIYIVWHRTNNRLQGIYSRAASSWTSKE